jgi:double-stranded uracil-DNA glycosylase
MPKGRAHTVTDAGPPDDGAAPWLRGLAPVSDARARVLVLGSMPGSESLRRQQYYAHPRNHFWPIMGELVGAGPLLPYADRLARLQAVGIAVWDVLAECAREGSLDASIDAASARVNDFAAFFARHPRIRHVFCNGGFSATTFRRRVVAAGGLPDGVAWTGLPSTSPANASVAYRDKLSAWRAVCEVLK